MPTSERLVVIGASGFGRECLDVLDAMISAGSQIEVIGVVDDGPSDFNLQRLAARNVAHLGAVREWMARGEVGVRFVLGIGSPQTRRRIVEQLEVAGHRAFTAVHPSATFGANPAIADGVVVCAGVAISNNVRLRRHVHVNPNATIGHDADLRDFVSINPAATISGGVVIGEETLVGSAATVLQNLSVGERTTIGAGALVTKPVPRGVIVKGVPGVWQ